MKFEIDVSGEDIFHSNYVICIANSNEEIRGFKFNDELSKQIKDNWIRGKYRYTYNPRKQGLFKVRIYCIIIHYLFKKIDGHKEIELYVCRDFPGHKNDIYQSLKYLLEKCGNRKIIDFKYDKLPKNSDAHCYAYLMYKDKHNKLPLYVDIKIEDIEPFLYKFNYIPKGHKTES